MLGAMLQSDCDLRERVWRVLPRMSKHAFRGADPTVRRHTDAVEFALPDIDTRKMCEHMLLPGHLTRIAWFKLMTRATTRGDVDTLKWIDTHHLMTAGDLQFVAYIAGSYGQYDVLEWVYNSPCAPVMKWSKLLCDVNGRLIQTLEWYRSQSIRYMPILRTLNGDYCEHKKQEQRWQVIGWLLTKERHWWKPRRQQQSLHIMCFICFLAITVSGVAACHTWA